MNAIEALRSLAQGGLLPRVVDLYLGRHILDDCEKYPSTHILKEGAIDPDKYYLGIESRAILAFPAHRTIEHNAIYYDICDDYYLYELN